MPRRKSVSDEEVLDLALEVLITEGPHRFTLPQVSAVVGLSASTLLQRFGSKQELLERLFARATEQLSESWEALPRSGDARADLLAWLVSMTRALETRERVAANLEMLMADISDEARRALAVQHLEQVRAVIREQLELLGSAQPEQHTHLLEAQWHGLVIQWAIHGEGSLDAWMQRGLGLALDTLGL